MSDQFLQLTYISTRHPQMADSEVERILAASRRNNPRHEITGFLLFNGRRFLQHLEGPAPQVEATFARIGLDPRHRALVVLGRKEHQPRVFGNWAMAFEQVSPVASASGETLVQQVERMVAGIDPHVANHFLGYARLTTQKAA